MTDKEKAEEYTNNIDTIIYDIDDNEINIAKYLRKAYLDGLAEGKPKWHDLRKDPNDLPKECENVLCLCSIGARYYTVGHLIKTDNDLSWWLNIGSKKLYNVIAWRELPEFEEEPTKSHRESICKGCEFENVSCDFYDENAISCHWWRSKKED